MKNIITVNDSALRSIIEESVRRVLMEQDSDRFETYYRGYDSSYGSQRNHMLWITDDLDYAKTYGNAVEEVVLDDTKMNIASIYEIDEIIGHEFDYYVGISKEEARMVLSQGYNGYGFYANNDESFCICLLSSDPIVSRKVI